MARDLIARSLPVVFAGLICLTVVSVFIGGIFLLIQFLRQPSPFRLIEEWCLARQLRIIRAERRFFLKGPFFLYRCPVFYVTARDPLGLPKYFWAGCGHPIFGMLSAELRMIPAN